MAKGVKPAGRAGGEGRRRPAPAPPADLPVPPETLFLATIPGATPSTWVERFTTRQRTVQLVNHDDAAQLAHLAHDDAGQPRHGRAATGAVYVGLAVTEIATLRAELSAPQVG